MITYLLFFIAVAAVLGACAIIFCTIVALYLSREIIKEMKDMKV